MALKVGDRVKIKPESWARVLNTEYPPSETEIIGKVSRNFENTTNIYYLTVFPGVWWEESDLISQEPDYEKVDSVFVNNHTLKVGYKFRCRCDYEITALYPVWDSAGKHFKEHAGNSFGARWVASPHCPIHAQFSKKH